MASPPWFAGIGLREWGTLPNSNFDTAGVIQTSPNGGTGVWNFWGGGALNSYGLYDGASFISGPFLVIVGGGHTDYGGNEVYAYGPINSSSPQCRRLRDRTTPFPQNVNEGADGSRPSCHIYSSCTYINDVSRNWMIFAGGLFRYTDAGAIPYFHYFDFNVASPNSNNPWGRPSTQITAGHTAGNACVYDPAAGTLWFHPDAQNAVATYSVTGNTYQRVIHKSPPGINGDTASAFDPTRGIWAMWSASNGICFFRTNNINNDYYVPSTSGSAPTTATGSIIYDEALDCFIVWTGGQTIYRLTPPATNPYQGGNAWVWSSETPAGGSTPSTKQGNGTFGRFQRVSNADCQGYILSNDYDEDIYFFRTGSVVAGGPPKGGLMLLGAGG